MPELRSQPATSVIVQSESLHRILHLPEVLDPVRDLEHDVESLQRTLLRSRGRAMAEKNRKCRPPDLLAAALSPPNLVINGITLHNFTRIDRM